MGSATMQSLVHIYLSLESWCDHTMTFWTYNNPLDLDVITTTQSLVHIPIPWILMVSASIQWLSEHIPKPWHLLWSAITFPVHEGADQLTTLPKTEHQTNNQSHDKSISKYNYHLFYSISGAYEFLQNNANQFRKEGMFKLEMSVFRNTVHLFKAEHVEVNRCMSSEIGSRNTVTWHGRHDILNHR